MERISGEKITEIVHESDLQRKWGRDKICTRWLDKVKKACNAKSLELNDLKMKCLDGEQCRVFVKSTNSGMNV